MDGIEIKTRRRFYLYYIVVFPGVLLAGHIMRMFAGVFSRDFVILYIVISLSVYSMVSLTPWLMRLLARGLAALWELW